MCAFVPQHIGITRSVFSRRFFWVLNEEFTCSIYYCRMHTVCEGQCDVQHRWECRLSHRGVYAFIPQHIGTTRSAFLRRFFWCWYYVHTCSIGWEIGKLVCFWVLRAQRASKKAHEGPTANDFANSCKEFWRLLMEGCRWSKSLLAIAYTSYWDP